MNRRFLMAVGAVLLTGLAARAEQRPNILFAFADDWGRLASAYAAVDGDEGLQGVARTPNFDAIAGRGVLFRNAFVNAPSCTPCRSSLLSGQYFWRTGRAAILQGAVWDPSIPAWPLMIKDKGYAIGKTWKVWSPGRPADAPFGRQEFAFQAAGGRFNRFSQTATRLVQQGKTVEQAKQVLLDDVARSFRELLESKGDRPFCYWFVRPTFTVSGCEARANSSGASNPTISRDAFPSSFPMCRSFARTWPITSGKSPLLIARLGVLVAELKAAGELENTLIVVSGDHGPPGFPHGNAISTTSVWP